MWDWDAQPPASRPRADVPWHLIAVVAIGAGLVGLLAMAVLLRIGSTVGPPSATRPGAAPDAGKSTGHQPTEEDAAEFADLLDSDRLAVVNRSPLNLAAGETLVLRGREDVVRVTPGRLVAGDDGGCGALTVAVTVEAGDRADEFGPSAFRLRTTGGADLPALDCGGAAVPGELRLAFPAAAPARLVYAPGGGDAQAVWQLR